MTSSRQAGSSTAGPPSPNGPPPAALAPQGSRALLSGALEQEIIPRLLQAQAAAVDVPDLAALTGRPVAPADIQEFARLVLLADDQPARDFAEAMRQRGVPVDALFKDLLTVTARYLGALWEQDLCTFSEVTIGVGRLQQTLRDLSPSLSRRHHFITAPLRALLLPTPGEQHTFGLVMVSEFFRSAGWDVSGGPHATVDPVAAVRREWFDVVAFSLASEVHLPRLAPTIAAVRKASQNPRLGVMVGGPLFLTQSSLATEVGADALAIDGSLAPEIATKLVDMRATLC